MNPAPEHSVPGSRPFLTRWRWPLIVAALLLGGLLVTWGVLRAQPQMVSVSGESVSTSRVFALSARRYALSADLLEQCQYTFYLTPEGQEWPKAGRAVASASGETGLSTRTDPLSAGRYFVHALTAPDEGCSWALRLAPQE